MTVYIVAMGGSGRVGDYVEILGGYQTEALATQAVLKNGRDGWEIVPVEMAGDSQEPQSPAANSHETGMSRKITVEGLFVSDEEGARIVLEGKVWPWFTLDDLIGKEYRDHPVRVEMEIAVTRLDVKPGEQ